MFHVEHMKNTISLIILALFLFGCNKPDPNPELKDPILKSMNESLSILEADLKATEKAILDAEKMEKNAVPLTGEAKLGVKRAHEARSNKMKIEQHIQFLKIRRETRIKKVREEYMRFFKAGKPWPDENLAKEHADYLKLKNSSLNWADRYPKEK